MPRGAPGGRVPASQGRIAALPMEAAQLGIGFAGAIDDQFARLEQGLGDLRNNIGDGLVAKEGLARCLRIRAGIGSSIR